MFSRHRAPNRIDDLGPIDRICPVTPDLLYRNEICAAGFIDTHHCARVRLQRSVAAFDGVLDVVRVVVDPADDDHILETADYEQLVPVQEAQVTGAQPTA